MAEIIHHGAAFWDALEHRADRDDDNLLLRYFDDARERTDPAYWPLHAQALEIWPTALRDYIEHPAESPWPGDRLRDSFVQSIDDDPPALRKSIFVSHRQCNRVEAEHLAGAILNCNGGFGGYDVWLDVWDPDLNRLNTGSRIAPHVLTALIIEMALLNSTAVVALITDASYGSNWIPYEFGRVKTGGPFAREASACLRDLNQQLHGYMLLTPRFCYDHIRDDYPSLCSWVSTL